MTNVELLQSTIKEPCHYHQQTKTHVEEQKALLKAYIIFLASHNIIMEIMQNLFIHNLYVSYTDIVHWKHIWHKLIRRCKMHVTFVHS
jgi:hypothetical protein